MSAEGTPIFVDDTGRRRALTRRAGRIVVIGFGAYLGLVVLGFARDPRVGPISLPSFGLPSLGLITPPAVQVLDAQESRTAAVAEEGGGDQTAPSGRRTTPSSTRPAVPAPASSTPTTAGTAPAAATGSTTTTAAPASVAKAGNGPKGSTTTTSATAPPPDPSTTTTSATTATTTTTSERGQGQGRDNGTTPAKGPDGGGAPGQLRKSTTSTTVS